MRKNKAFDIENISSFILNSQPSEWRNTIKEHILNGQASCFGASSIDIYLVAYVSETHGAGKSRFF